MARRAVSAWDRIVYQEEEEEEEQKRQKKESLESVVNKVGREIRRLAEENGLSFLEVLEAVQKDVHRTAMGIKKPHYDY